MKHVTLFSQLAEYQTFMGGGDGLKPNVSYVREDSKVYSTGTASEDFSGAVVYAKYNISDDMSKTGLFNTSNVKALKVDGEVMEFEPEVEMSSELTVLSENISFDMENETYNVPEEYLFDNSKLSSLVVRPANGDISAYNAVCISVSMSGMNNPMPLMFEDAEGMGVVVDYENNMIDLSPMLEMLSMYYPGNTSVCMLSVDENYETLVFGDTLVSISGIAGGMPVVFDFESAGEHELEVLLKNGESLVGMFTNNLEADYGLVEVIIPDSVKYLDEHCFDYCSSLTDVSFLGNGVKSIGSYAFQSCKNLTTITLPDSVEFIGHYAFGNCENLTTISLPDSVETLEYSAFYECGRLTSVKLPNGISDLDWYTFYNCVALDNVVIPDSVTVIDDNCFNGCSSLTSVTINSQAIASMKNLYNKFGKQVTSYILGNGITSIGEQAFFTCDNIVSVTLPDGLTSIGDYAFYSCDSLVSINFPNSLTTIGGSAFDSCTSLSSITLPDGLTTIGDSVFWNCTNLSSITLPNGLESIGTATFGNCTNLSTITLPSHLKSVGMYTFQGCKNLKEIYALPSTPPTINISFIEVASNGVLYHPYGSDYSSWKVGGLANWEFVANLTITECTNLTITANNVKWDETTTTIHYTATVNGVDSLGNMVTDIVITGTTVSDEFEENKSDETIERVITFEYMGVTATTTILQTSNLKYLGFTAINDCGFTFTKNGNGESISFSIDNGVTWGSLISGMESPTIKAGESIYWKSNITPSDEGIGYFSSTGSFKAHGNVMSLLYGDDFEGQTSLEGKDEAFKNLFKNCYYLNDASSLILPATTLAEGCYYGIFYYCTSLTTAPELPATTLADNCYSWMFYNCTNLKTAPELPATTLVNDCYNNMFFGCTSLNHITMLATDISANSCLLNWVKGVSSTGTFIKSYEVVALPIGQSGIPSDWTIENKFECEAVSLSITADNVACYMTSTTIHYESVVNLCNKDGEVVDTITVTGTAQSEPFPINTSETDIVERTISFTFCGKTATTTITQGVYTKPLTFVALEDGTFSYTKKGTGDDLQYSKDNGTTWTSLASGETISVVTGDKVLWKSKQYPKQVYGIGNFTSTGRFEARGNVMSLLFGDDYIEHTDLTGKYYAFNGLFSGCTNLTTAPELPATILENNCYDGMFSGCTNLTTAPELPATTLDSACYQNMFRGCTSLTTAPSMLPATTLADFCYNDMFSACESLTTAPELPATTLGNNCYYNMFSGCTNLTTTPELPATTLAKNCYSYMFRGCTRLTTVPELPATTLADSCYEGIFEDCSSLTTTPELPATELAYECYYAMFKGCTSLITAPELPATTLADYCYQYMFNGCTSLITAPELPVTTLTEGCYYGMFEGCTNLTTAPVLPATTSVKNCYHSMFYKCTSLITAPELPAATLAEKCYYAMFYGCSGLTTAPELPATTLAEGCYRQLFSHCENLTTAPELPATILADYCYCAMFGSCSKLTTAPELPATTLGNNCYDTMFAWCTSLSESPVLHATTLAEGCYMKMFYACTNIKRITMLATDISATDCLKDWVSHASYNCTFVKHPDMTSLPTGTSGIPNSWTVEDYQG